MVCGSGWLPLRDATFHALLSPPWTGGNPRRCPGSDDVPLISSSPLLIAWPTCMQVVTFRALAPNSSDFPGAQEHPHELSGEHH